MNQHVIFGPVITQVLLVMVVYLILAKRKASARKDVDRSKTALNPKAWPDNVVKVSNNIDNQFELPVLFYVVCGALWAMQGVTMTTLILAWLFVASRIIHAWVHTHSNYVPNRLRLFTLGFLIVLVLAGFVIGKLVQLTI